MMDLGTSLMTGLKLLLSPVVEECWYSHTCTCMHTHTHTQTIDRHAGHVFIQSLCRYPTAMHFDDADKGLPHSILSLSPPSLSLPHLSHPPKHTHTHTHENPTTAVVSEGSKEAKFWTLQHFKICLCAICTIDKMKRKKKREKTKNKKKKDTCRKKGRKKEEVEKGEEKRCIRRRKKKSIEEDDKEEKKR